MKDNVHEEMETPVSGFPMNDVGILLAESSTNNLMDVISYMGANVDLRPIASYY
jgi:hypothetical protein